MDRLTHWNGADEAMLEYLNGGGVTMEPIPGYPSYMIDKEGRVYGFKGRELRPYSRDGYMALGLIGPDGKRKNIDVHRLMAFTYLGLEKGAEPKMWVNHKDGDKGNNRLENLEVDTPRHNHEHARDVLHRRYNRGLHENGAGKLTYEAVELIREALKLGWTQHRLAKAFTVSQASISLIANNKTWDLSKVWPLANQETSNV